MWGMFSKHEKPLATQEELFLLEIISNFCLRTALIISKSEIFFTIKFIRRSDRTPSEPSVYKRLEHVE